MAVILRNSAILHIPKTAGKYVRTVLDLNEVPYRQTSRNTQCVGMGRVLNGLRSSHCIPYSAKEYQARKNRLVFVRHPLTWYLSYWAFRVRFKDTDKHWMYWRKDSEFDQLCGDDDFNRFIDNVLERWPGFLTAFFRYYTSEASDVGEMENIDRDLLAFLHKHEDVERLNYPGLKVNTSDHKSAKYTWRQASAIMNAECDIIDEYNYYWIPEGIVEE